ncbi:MAG: sulfatase-like hydrolase/transferase, partial [bacterium]|nr:sulfatase-like hydrolase/transferase [bacterium]
MKRPNILIFMTDHQRGDTVLPEHPAIMPNIERLAREGVTFSETFCTMAHCCPARASFFTGLYPTRHGVWNNLLNGQRLSTGLKPGVRLFSDHLTEAGYDLYYSGKWHVSLDERPADRGWRELAVNSIAGQRHELTWELLEKGAAQPLPATRRDGDIVMPGYGVYQLYGRVEDAPNHKTDEDCVERACAVIRETAGTNKPWVIYVGTGMPHAPYKVPGRYLDMYRPEDVPLPASYRDTMDDKPGYYRKLRRMRFDQLSEREARESIRHFWAMCTYLDDMFGRLLKALDETGQAEDTLVLYTSDHGDYMAEHGLFEKGVPSFRGAYHVPAVVRWPAGIRNPGRQVDGLVSLVDFAPPFT